MKSGDFIMDDIETVHWPVAFAIAGSGVAVGLGLLLALVLSVSS